MKLLSAFTFLAALSSTLAAPASDIVPNQYIVKFKTGASALLRSNVLMNRLGTQGRIVEIGNEFTGFVGKLSDSAAEELRSHPQVELVEPNRVIRVDPIETKPIADNELPEVLAEFAAQTENLSWGLDRLDQRDLPLDGKYDFPENAGEGVFAYIIDTGILPTHSDFEDRAIVGGSFVKAPEDEKLSQNKTPGVDGHGHGTHVSSTVGGKNYGVSKKSTLIGVQVLDARGSGTLAGVIEGIEWAVKDCKETRKAKRCVANLSLGGSYSQPLNDAVDAAVKAGLVVVVAAGNENQNADDVSPASSKYAVTVAASDIGRERLFSKVIVDKKASFSNWGPAVNVWAPGANILGASIQGKDRSVRFSGTSMARLVFALFH